MINIASILLVLFKQTSSPRINEDVLLYECTTNCSGANADIKAALEKLINGEVYRDQVQLTVSVDDEPFTFDSNSADNASFFSEWDSFQGSEDADSNIVVTVIVSKKKHDGSFLFVYDFPSFMVYLEGLSIHDLLSVFSKLFLNKEDAVFFVSPTIKEPFYTGSIFFVADLEQKELLDESSKPVDHASIWGRLNNVSYFSGMASCLVLPEDFLIVKSEGFSQKIQASFNKCCLLLSLAAIYDFTELQAEALTLKVNGYKSLNVRMDLASFDVGCMEHYYKIYEWVLASGSIHDKIGLARNIISLNILPNDYAINESVFISIISGFKVYEKQNIKQYIELRNKMSDQLIGFSEKAGKIAETFSGNFQKSALAVVSLYATIIVSRILSSHDFSRVFTLDATILSMVFLLVSFIYLMVSKAELKEQKNRFIESYTSMKKRNEDLLTKDDIDRILNGDHEHSADKLFIEKIELRVSFQWIGFIAVLAIATLVLFAAYA